jgi:hypothetical protein
MLSFPAAWVRTSHAPRQEFALEPTFLRSTVRGAEFLGHDRSGPRSISLPGPLGTSWDCEPARLAYIAAHIELGRHAWRAHVRPPRGPQRPGPCGRATRCQVGTISRSRMRMSSLPAALRWSMARSAAAASSKAYTEPMGGSIDPDSISGTRSRHC